jgi:predicted phosphoadenosine phosphosulfate sulfurtransferase
MIVERRLDIDVLAAARQRIANIFANGLPVYLSFSGGKDSLVLADIAAKMVAEGAIDPRRLRVEFIDEEAIFPCVDAVVRRWREKFLLMGARFDWYCLEVRHYSCLNQLENDESFICWDRRKADCWIREPPPFAIRSHPRLVPREDTYQQFLLKVCDGPHMTGLRVFESVQRRVAIALQKPVASLAKRQTVEPIYDWRDDDVWRYLSENDIDIPAAYMHLFQIGVPARALRISQFFSVDTAHTLARVGEFYPGLMERILRREPAAYIVSLYWDSEMFRRRTAKRREMERGAKPRDAKALVFALLANINGNFQSAGGRKLAHEFKKLLLSKPYIADEIFEDIHDALIAGDPKKRSYRAIIAHIERNAADAFIPNNGALIISPSAAKAGAVHTVSKPRRSQTEQLQSKYSPGRQPRTARAVDPA